MHRLEVVLLPDGHLGTQQHIARVHALRHVHGGDAGHVQPVQDCSLHGRGAAQCREQGAVDVDATVLWRLQDVRRQNFPICDNDNQLRRQGFERIVKAPVPQAGGLKDRQSVRGCVGFDGGRSQDIAPSARFIGLCHDAYDLLAGAVQCAQGRDGEIRGSHE